MQEGTNSNSLIENNLHTMATQEHRVEHPSVSNGCPVVQGASQKRDCYSKRAASFSSSEKAKPVNLTRTLSSYFTKEGN